MTSHKFEFNALEISSCANCVRPSTRPVQYHHITAGRHLSGSHFIVHYSTIVTKRAEDTDSSTANIENVAIALVDKCGESEPLEPALGATVLVEGRKMSPKLVIISGSGLILVSQAVFCIASFTVAVRTRKLISFRFSDSYMY
uniref:Uncharacterized protein n=1 Tax=Anopheles culicifacies TaxID=139723 RepID=A0A182M3W3_9DIPT